MIQSTFQCLIDFIRYCALFSALFCQFTKQAGKGKKIKIFSYLTPAVFNFSGF